MIFHIARTAATTGVLLQELVRNELRESGGVEPGGVEICYGVGYNGAHKALNANCSRYNKFEQAVRLRIALGDRSLEVFPDVATASRYIVDTGRPLFARDVVHSRGRDIKIALETWQLAPLMAGGTGFFTAHVPSVREFRTWGYRGYHLGSYEKTLTRQAECRKLGRNYANGFDFNGIDNDDVPNELKSVCKDALIALGLDFGAVDTLQRADGSYVVLEVNSAPGVAHERRRVITGLAHRIVRWIANDCPDRRE